MANNNAEALSKKKKIKETRGDTILNVITSAILIFVIIVVGYPVIYVISCSFSASSALEAGRVILWPVEPSLEAYDFVMQYKQVWVGFRNSVLYTISDVFLQMTMTILVAYPLSRRNFQGRAVYTMIFYLTTRVSAGLIPQFILKCDMGLFNNVWAVILSGSVSVSHILILRTAFTTSIPGELFDSAMIDGANHFQCMIKIAVPLAKATMSVLTLYCIVGQWNEYFTSMIYLRDNRLYPLQLVLRPIMTAASSIGTMDVGEMSSASQEQAKNGLENVRYALIVISTVPVLCAYFVVQKYFKGGVMMGSVKG